MFKVYLLQSLKDKSYYIGYTSDIEIRIEYHNTGKVKYTKKKMPWQLLGYEEFKTENEARWREYTLKHNANERYKFIKNLINKIYPAPLAQPGRATAF